MVEIIKNQFNSSIFAIFNSPSLFYLPTVKKLNNCYIHDSAVKKIYFKVKNT